MFVTRDVVVIDMSLGDCYNRRFDGLRLVIGVGDSLGDDVRRADQGDSHLFARCTGLLQDAVR